MVALPGLQFSIKADLSGLKAVDRELGGLGNRGKSVGQAISNALKQSASDAAGSFRDAGNKSGNDFGNEFQRGADGKLRDSMGRFVSTAKNAGGDAGKGFSGAFKGAIGNVFQGISQGIGQQLTAGLGSAIAGLKGLAIDREAIASYDKARAQVSTLTSDMAGMAKMAQEVSKSVGGSASQTEVLAASYDVLSAGFSEAADAASILTNAQKGAIGGMSDLNTVSNATTTILNAYGLAAKDADKVVNQMIGTQNAGKIVVGEYANKIGAVATTAAQAGVSLEELNAFIATATVKGVSANSSIDGMRSAIAAVLKPSQEASEYAAQLGVNFSAAGLRAGGLSGILGTLREKNADSADSLVKLFGSVEAVAAIIPSAGDGIKDFAKNLETIKGASADDAFAKMENSIEGLSKKNAVLREELALKFQVATAPLFEAANNGMTLLLQSLNEGGLLFEGLNQAAASFRDFMAENPQIIQTMTAAFTELLNSGILLLQDSIIGFTNALRENPQLIQDMVGSLAGAVQMGAQFAQGMGTAFTNIGNMLAPLAQLVGGMSGSADGANSLAAAFGQIAVYAAVFAPIVSALGAIVSVGTTIFGVFGAIGGAISGMFAGITGFGGALAAAGALIAPILLGLTAAFIWLDNIKNYSENWNDVLLGINFTFQECIGWIGGVFNSITQTIQQSQIFQGVWRVVTQVVQFLIKPYQDIFNAIVQTVQKSEFFRGIWDSLKGIAQGVADAFKNFVGGALDGLIQRAQSLFGWMQKMAGFGGGGGGNAGGSASEGDKFVGAVLSILEAPSRQGRLDVAQVVSNRVGTNFGGAGANIRDQAFAQGQFQPFFAETYGIGKNDIQNKDTAIKALQKAGYSVQQATEAIDNFFADIADNAKVADSAAKVGGRAYFKGVSEYGNMQSSDFLRNQGENFFHHEDKDTTNRVQGSISGLFGGAASGGGFSAPTGPGKTQMQGSISGQLDGSGQNGADMDVGPNNEMYSYHNGVVSQMGTAGNNGNYVVIDYLDDLGNKLEATYSHIASAVQVGQQVVGGQVLGTFDASGRTFGAHNSIDINSPGTNGALQRDRETEAARRGADLLVQGKVQGVVGGGGMAMPQFQQPAAPQQYQQSSQSPLAALTVPGGEKLNLTQSFAAGKINNTVGGGKIDNTVANLKADKNAENQAMVQAVKIARDKEDAATKTKREDAARQLKQAREAQKLELEGNKAGLVTPEAKEASDRALKELEVRAQYEDRLLDMEQKRADLVKARDRKLTDSKSKDVAVSAAAKALPDFSAQIKSYDALIAKDKELQASALKNITIGEDAKQTEADRTSAIARRNAELETSIEFDKTEMTLALERASRTDPLLAKQIEFANQRKELQTALKKELQEEFDKLTDIGRKLAELAKAGLTDSPETRRLQADRNTANMRIGDMQAANKNRVVGLDESEFFETEKLNRDRASALFEKDSMMAEGGINARRKTGERMRGLGNIEGANKVEKEAALEELGLQYRQKQLALQSRLNDLRSKGVEVSEADAQAARDQLTALEKADISKIKEQFNTFQSEIMPTVQSSLSGFFKSLMDGSKSVGDAFSDMIGNITSKIFDFAANQIVSSLLGGLFGGKTSGGSGAGAGGIGGGILGIFGLASGGIVQGQGQSPLRAIPAIDEALRREGPTGVLAALTPGEMVLTTRQTQAFLNNPMANEILNFSSGGMVGRTGSPILQSTASNPATNVNIALNVASGSGDGIDYGIVAKVAQRAADESIRRQQKPRGILNR